MGKEALYQSSAICVRGLIISHLHAEPIMIILCSFLPRPCHQGWPTQQPSGGGEVPAGMGWLPEISGGVLRPDDSEAMWRQLNQALPLLPLWESHQVCSPIWFCNACWLNSSPTKDETLSNTMIGTGSAIFKQTPHISGSLIMRVVWKYMLSPQSKHRIARCLCDGKA